MDGQNGQGRTGSLVDSHMSVLNKPKAKLRANALTGIKWTETASNVSSSGWQRDGHPGTHTVTD